MPISAGSCHPDLSAVLFDVGRHKNERKIWMVIILLEIGNGKAKTIGEIAIFFITEILLLEHDQPVLAEQVLQLPDCLRRRLFGIDRVDAAAKAVLFRSHGCSLDVLVWSDDNRCSSVGMPKT